MAHASTIEDITDVDLWVMDPEGEFIDDLKPLSENDLFRVQGVPGHRMGGSPLQGAGPAQTRPGPPSREEVLRNRLYHQVIVWGSMTPPWLCAAEGVPGSLADLRRPDAVIMDEGGYRYLWPAPLENAVGRALEMNDHRAVIVGLCKASPTFQTLPIL